MAFNGTDMLLQVNTGTVMTPTWSTVGSQRDCSIEDSIAEIDVSSKDGREMEVLPGRVSYQITLDHLYVPGSTEQDLIKTSARAGTLVQLQELEDSVAGDVYSGYITSRNISFPDQGESVVSLTLRVTGAPA